LLTFSFEQSLCFANSQMAHLATTYAAVNALVTVGGEKALGSIDRVKLLGFLLRMKQPSGGFAMHEGGEIDVRGCYTAISVAHIVNIITPELVENVPEYMSSCQTYEGGIGAEPGGEAHGGYTFCGLAALALIDKVHALDLPALLNWVVFRQGRVEGGFQGRTNKLVDGCYSLWQGGIFSIIQQIMPELNRQQLASDGPLWAFHEQFVSYSISKTDEPPGEDATPSSSSKDIETGIQTTEECIVREVGRAQDDSELEESTSTRRVAEGGIKSTTAGVQHQPSSSVNTWCDKTEATSAGFSSRQTMTAEYLFPVVDSQVKRAPISVTFEEVSDEVLDTSCNSDKPELLKKRCSIVDQLLNEDKQVLYGPLDNPQALQAYILLCCQVLDGGLRDKPGKSPDYYHTCYCLSGLTLAQNSAAHRINAPPPPKAVLGPYSNVLEPVHPLCNVDLNKYNDAVRYFKHQPF